MNYPNVTLYGFETSQQFVPIRAETGMLASSGSVRVTGTLAPATIVEVRTSPARTLEVPEFVRRENETVTGFTA